MSEKKEIHIPNHEGGRWEPKEILLGFVAIILLLIMIVFLIIHSIADKSSASKINPAIVEANIKPFGEVSVINNPTPATSSAAVSPASASTSTATTKKTVASLPVKKTSSKVSTKTTSTTTTEKVVTNMSAKKVTSNVPSEPAMKNSDMAEGKKIFEGTCIACHGSGVLGAPKAFSKTDWAPRLAQGKATLLQHAMNGYKAMPPHGGNPSLTEAQLSAAIDYMSTPK